MDTFTVSSSPDRKEESIKEEEEEVDLIMKNFRILGFQFYGE